MKANIGSFIKTDIWLVRAEELPPVKAFLVRSLKLILLVLDGFTRDQCSLRASALTLYTMLSIVPVIAMLFGIAKGFGFENNLKQQLLEQIPQQETMMVQLMEFAEQLLANTKGGVVAGIGLAVLFFTVIKVISNIEESFNHIWKVEKSRPVGRKISDYLSLMLLAPLLLIASSSITVFVKTQIAGLSGSFEMLDYGTSMALHLLNYSSWVILWILFSVTFIFMPNTKVNLFSGIMAGVITGTLYQLVQGAYVSLQIGVSSYNAIYGSFAALPLFVIWLQIGWLIVLLGCELSYYHQHLEHYRHKDTYANISFSMQKAIALQITHLLTTHFAKNGEPLSINAITEALDLPISIVQPMVAKLLHSGLLTELKVEDDEDALFQPAQDINKLTVRFVIEALENDGYNQVPDATSLSPFINITQQFNELLNASDGNRLLKEMKLP